MTKALVKTQIRLQQMVANRERGQGTLEYIGMIVIAGIFAAGLVGLARGANLNVKFTKALTDIFGA
jgi:hypothetical protein